MHDACAAVPDRSTVADLVAALKHRLGIPADTVFHLYSSTRWLPLALGDTIERLQLDSLSVLTIRVTLPGGAAPSTTAADEWDHSMPTPAKLDYLVLLLSNLPGTIPTSSKTYQPECYAPADEWIENIGCVKGAVNRQLEVVFGARQSPDGKPRVVTFQEQGPGLLAVVDVLRAQLLGAPPSPSDGLLIKWLDDLIDGARAAFSVAVQQVCVPLPPLHPCLTHTGHWCKTGAQA